MLGAFVFRPLGDRWGRKPVLVATTAFFGLATVTPAFSTSVEMLIVLRFVTDIGLEGAMPAAITLTAEFCPAQRRYTLVTLTFCGFTIGSAAARLSASHIVAVYGWQGVLELGGVLPPLITTTGFSMQNAAPMTATPAIGGTVRTIVIGRMMDRFEPHRVLALAFQPKGGFGVAGA